MVKLIQGMKRAKKVDTCQPSDSMEHIEIVEKDGRRQVLKCVFSVKNLDDSEPMAGALIGRVTEDAAKRCEGNLEAVITGGDAGRILPVLRHPPRHDRDLVLKGVAILARETLCGT